MPRLFETIFISTCFCEDCGERARAFADFLSEFDIRYDFGENFGGHQEITEGVRSRIDACSLGVVILSRKTKIGENSWAPSQWVISEAVRVDALGKPLIVLAESGVVIDGLLKNKEHLVFEPHDGFNLKFLLRVLRQVKKALDEYDLTIGLKLKSETLKETAAVHAYISNEPIEDECGDDAKQLIDEVKELSRQGLFEEALKRAMRAAEIAPDCWRAYTSIGALLAKLCRLAEADKVLSDVLRKFRHNNKARACAFHNKAGILEAKSRRNPSTESLFAQRSLLEESLQLDPDRLYTRASLVIVLTQLGEMSQAEKIIEDSLTYRDFPEAFLFELESRGIVVEILSKLPRWVERLLSSIRRGNPDEHGD